MHVHAEILDLVQHSPRLTDILLMQLQSLRAHTTRQVFVAAAEQAGLLERAVLDSEDVADWLLNQGVHPDAAPADPDHARCRPRALGTVLRHHHLFDDERLVARLRSLLDAGASADRPLPGSLRTALDLAIPRSVAVETLLARQLAPITVAGGLVTALLATAPRPPGNLATRALPGPGVLGQLIRRARPNLVGPRGLGAQHAAALAGNTELLGALLLRGYHTQSGLPRAVAHRDPDLALLVGDVAATVRLEAGATALDCARALCARARLFDGDTGDLVVAWRIAALEATAERLTALAA